MATKGRRVLKPFVAPMEQWPTFTEAQVSFLEDLFPDRCLLPGEPVEAHLRYAGKVDLIASMRERVIGAIPHRLDLAEDEEEALDAEAVATAEAQQRGTT